MFTIPSEQKIDPVRGGQRQMHRIRRSSRRDDLFVQQAGNQNVHFWRRPQSLQSVKQRETPGCKPRITTGYFTQHDLGNQQFIFLPPEFPPFLRRLLICRQLSRK